MRLTWRTAETLVLIGFWSLLILRVLVPYLLAAVRVW